MTTVRGPLETEAVAPSRVLELVWLVPVLVATAAALLTTARPAVVAPLLALALIPWVLQAVRRPLPMWAFGLLALVPVAVLLVVEGLSSAVFLGTTAISMLASRASRPWQLAAVSVLAVGLPFLSGLSPHPFDPGSFYFAIGDLFAIAVGVLLGYALRLATELRAADARLLAVRAQQERTRLARDVHDLVAHSLTVVVLHVGGARRILRSDPDHAAQALEQAEQTCRESLDGIRRVVGLLRTDDDLAPGGDLLALITTYRAVGMPLRADLDPRLDQLPLFLRGVLHRVAQETLSNAARYRSPDAPVELTCRTDDAGVTFTLVNATADHRPSAGGFGLPGLREQVAAAGGTLTARREGDRFLVECHLPVHAPAVRAGEAAR